MKSLIDQPKKILEIIDLCLKPKQNEKKKFGEVFTPMKLVYEMLDALPKGVWKKKNYKWLDPANGMGNFPIAIYLRLMKGLEEKIPNEKERKKHILENMLYMIELNKKNVFICKNIFDINDKYKLHLVCHDALTFDCKKEWNIEKFDIVIGNPPYNKELTRVGALPLYNEFIEKYIDQCQYLMFIVPSRWFSGGKGLNKFRKFMLKRKDIMFIQHEENASKLFGNLVDIKGGINYFLKDSEYEGKCKFGDSMIEMGKYDILVNSKYYSIIDKLNKINNITTIYRGLYYGIESNDKHLTDDKTLIKCYVSKQKGFIKYIDKKYIKNDISKWKVITTRASYKANSGFGNTFIGQPSEIHTGSYISFENKNKSESESLLSYIKCRLPNFMLSQIKNSQDISEFTCKWIPLPPLDRIWTDDEVYKYFKLTNDDIQLVNDTNIIGYKKQK